MRSLLGFFLLGISFFGTIFFRNYKGNLIAHPIILYSFCLVIGMIGAWCVFSVSSSRRTKEIEAHEKRVEEFRAKSDIVPINIANCDFKNGRFQQEMEDPARAEMVTTRFQTAMVSKKSLEGPIQSYMVYRFLTGNKEYKYVSQAFPFDENTLEFHVMNKDVSLYVDRIDKSKYLFVLMR